MSVPRSLLRACLLVFGLVIASASPQAGEGPTSSQVKAVGPAWIAAVRTSVVRALLKIRRTASVGVLEVRFTVTKEGRVLGVHVDGPRRNALKAAAVVGAIGHVPPPPDHLSHPISVRVHFH